MENRIREILNEKHMTQVELAVKAELQPTMISRYAWKETIPKVTTAIRIAKVLGVKVEDIWGEDDE